MAALGKGNSRTVRGRWLRRGAVAAIAVTTLLGVDLQPATASQDPLFPLQWNLQQIGAPTAWQRSTGAGVRIGIVDSGVFAAQEDLAGKVVAATDCLDTGGDPGLCAGSGQDDTGHGTHMAGVAAATKDNGRGIAGVAPDARLVVARVLTDNGGSIVDVEAGIRWVVEHGAQVVNLSLADNPLAQRPVDLSYATAVEQAWAAGAVPVVAAGNITSLGPDREDFASLDALVVGATDARGVVQQYSNPLSTAKWGILAPGGSATGDRRDVISTWRDPSAPNATNLYAFRGGALVAAAHVSGVVALLLAEGLSPAEAVQRIVATARPVACGVGCHGLVDAAAAVDPGTVRVAHAAASGAAPAVARPSPERVTTPTSASRSRPSVPTTAAAAPSAKTADGLTSAAPQIATTIGARATGDKAVLTFAAWGLVVMILGLLGWGEAPWARNQLSTPSSTPATCPAPSPERPPRAPPPSTSPPAASGCFDTTRSTG
jgi:thermitase